MISLKLRREQRVRGRKRRTVSQLCDAKKLEHLPVLSKNCNIVLVHPPNYSHALGLWEICRLLQLSFADLGFEAAFQVNRLVPDAVNVVVGYHLIADPRSLAGYQVVFYQLEQLSLHEGWFTERLRAVLQCATEIWDPSLENIAFLNSVGLLNVKHLPIGFHQGLATVEKRGEDIDVLFYGSLNKRRGALIQRIGRLCRVESAFDVYGQARDALIARSKIVLNVHFYDAQILEQVRISYLLNNGRFVLSESSPSNPYEGMLAVGEYDQLPALCAHFLADEAERRNIARNGRALFGQRPMSQYLRSIIA